MRLVDRFALWVSTGSVVSTLGLCGGITKWGT